MDEESPAIAKQSASIPASGYQRPKAFRLSAGNHTIQIMLGLGKYTISMLCIPLPGPRYYPAQGSAICAIEISR